MIAYIPSVAETVLGMITLMVCACLLARLRKPAAPVRDEQLIRRHRRIREHQLGEAYRNDGHTLPQALMAMAMLTGVLLFIPIVVFIITTVMGAQEPRW